MLNFAQMGALDSIKKTYAFGQTVTNETLTDPAVMKLINSDEKFDLIVLEIFMNDAMLGKWKRAL